MVRAGFLAVPYLWIGQRVVPNPPAFALRQFEQRAGTRPGSAAPGLTALAWSDGVRVTMTIAGMPCDQRTIVAGLPCPTGREAALAGTCRGLDSRPAGVPIIRQAKLLHVLPHG